MYRVFLAALALCAAIPALADDATRAAVREALADAGAHAAMCKQVHWEMDRKLSGGLYVGANFTATELDGITARMGAIADQLAAAAPDVVCRDADERYGPKGDVVKGLLVAQ